VADITCETCGQPVKDTDLEALKARYLALDGPAAVIPPELWDALTVHRDLARENELAARDAEKQIRAIIGTALRIKVGTRIVGRRIIQPVTGASYVKDYIRRLPS